MTVKNWLARFVLGLFVAGFLAACVLVRVPTEIAVPIGGHRPLLGAAVLFAVVVTAAFIGVVALLVWAIMNAAASGEGESTT